MKISNLDYGRFINEESRKEIEKTKSNLIDEIYSNQYIRYFLNANKLSTDFVNSHIIQLLEMIESHKNCENCKGYLKCNNTPKGLVKSFDITNDSLIYIDCKCIEEINPIKQKYIIRDFPEEWLYNNFDKLATNKLLNPIIDKFVDSLKLNNGIYLYGQSGVGKTFITAAYTNEYIDLGHKYVCFVNFRNFIEDLKSMFDDKNGYINNQVIMLKQVDCLVLDDLGAEKVSEWSTNQILYEILDERLRTKKLTLFTSLYSLNELQKLYGGNNPQTIRLISKIKALAQEVALEGINYNE